MPTYTVYFGQMVIERGSIDIEAADDEEASRLAKEVDPMEIDNWRPREIVQTELLEISSGW